MTQTVKKLRRVKPSVTRKRMITSVLKGTTLRNASIEDKLLYIEQVYNIFKD